MGTAGRVLDDLKETSDHLLEGFEAMDALTKHQLGRLERSADALEKFQKEMADGELDRDVFLQFITDHMTRVDKMVESVTSAQVLHSGAIEVVKKSSVLVVDIVNRFATSMGRPDAAAGSSSS
ncbi:hypothetical protein NMY22_g7997 [Coprinellus aureogranulatus]|nr:hypothetical protein NMY22_g7997 [Coprinellus aureogranulatus]